MGRKVRESNPGGGENFRTRPDRPWGPTSHLSNGYRVFLPGGKSAGTWRWPLTPSSAEVKERVELYVYSPSGLSWPVLGWTLPFTFTCNSGLGLKIACSWKDKTAQESYWGSANVPRRIQATTHAPKTLLWIFCRDSFSSPNCTFVIVVLSYYHYRGPNFGRVTSGSDCIFSFAF